MEANIFMENNTAKSKPLILIRQECLETLVNTINNSGLPSFIIESMLRDLLNEVQSATCKEYETTLKWYNEQCKEAENNENQ